MKLLPAISIAIVSCGCSNPPPWSTVEQLAVADAPLNDSANLEIGEGRAEPPSDPPLDPALTVLCSLPVGKPQTIHAVAKTGQDIEFIRIPAGCFWIGCSPVMPDECSESEKPGHIVYLPAYDIMRFRVAIGMLKGTDDPRQFVVDRGEVQWDGNSSCAQLFENAHLPSEAQWEKAARGGCETTGAPCGAHARVNTWGNSAPCAALCQAACIEDQHLGSCPASCGLPGWSDAAETAYVVGRDTSIYGVENLTLSQYLESVSTAAVDGRVGEGLPNRHYTLPCEYSMPSINGSPQRGWGNLCPWPSVEANSWGCGGGAMRLSYRRWNYGTNAFRCVRPVVSS